MYGCESSVLNNKVKFKIEAAEMRELRCIEVSESEKSDIRERQKVTLLVKMIEQRKLG